MQKVIANHPWKNNSADNSKTVITYTSMVVFTSDGDVDADGSPRVGSIDPTTGQSETSLRRSNGWQGDSPYVNSEIVPFFVLPRNWQQITDIPIALGDMARLSYNGNSIYAILADIGPDNLIGEMSVCAVEALGFNPWNADHTRIVRGIPGGVKYEIVPSSNALAITKDFRSIQDYGQKLFGTPPAFSKTFSEPKKGDNTLWSNLKRGDKGSAVSLLQKELNEHFKSGLEEDGDFGKLTENAVRSAEKAMGLKEDGIADEDFWGRLCAYKPVPQPVKPVPPPKTFGPGTPWMPFAKRMPEIPTRWTYDGGWPTGAIVHFTAGRDNPEGTVAYLGQVGYPCLVVGKNGIVFQPFPCSRGGYHSGTYHHKYSVGIEVVSAGRCEQVSVKGITKFKAWFHKKAEEYFGKEVMRFGSDKQNAQAGWYEAFTSAQEAAIIKTILWYKWADPTGRFDLDKVVGHDEACDQAGRHGDKNDPGWALSMTMPEFRTLLKNKYKELVAKTKEQQAAYFNS